MLFTLAICTWNGSNTLEKVLINIEDCQVPRGVEWEIIVVDNNSTDNTKDVVSKFLDKLPLVYFFEGEQGLSHARNKVLTCSKGDWIIFTDDDVEIPNTWLLQYAMTLKFISDKYSFVGGEVRPKFLAAPPDDVLAGIPIVADGFCGISLPSKLIISEPNDKIPFGANFAVKKSHVENIYFDPSLGVNGDQRLVGEETAFMQELLNRGRIGHWLIDISLYHTVDEDRLSDEYLKKYLYGMGRSIVLKSKEPKKTVVPYWAYRAVLEDLIYLTYNKYFSKDQGVKKYLAMRRCYQWIGIIKEVLILKLQLFTKKC
jgi:glycosyltransferase involved in cell wall biosynthesis